MPTPEREAVAGVVPPLRRAALLLTDERWAMLGPLVEACGPPAKVPPRTADMTRAGLRLLHAEAASTPARGRTVKCRWR